MHNYFIWALTDIKVFLFCRLTFFVQYTITIIKIEKISLLRSQKTQYDIYSFINY